MKNYIKKNFLFHVLNYKVIVLSGIICFVVFGIPYSIKNSIEKYAHKHELQVDIQSMHFNWRIWKIPGLILTNVNMKNLGVNPTFTNIKAKNIAIDPDYFEYFKSYTKNYNFTVGLKDLKVFLINGSLLETDAISSNVNYKNNVYKIYNFNSRPLQINLGEKNSICLKDSKEKSCEGRLLIYGLKGEGEYHVLGRILEIYLKASKESSQLPQGNPYSIQVRGKIKYLGMMPYQYAEAPEDPGVRGVITYTVDNFSSFLHQLNQAKFISHIAENLGTLIGYPIPRVDPFTQQTEIFTNAVSLDMTFKPDGTYLGKIKL